MDNKEMAAKMKEKFLENQRSSASESNENRIFYHALCTHDNRFDGKFFVGVSSTGIYCRPVCRVRIPKAENCTFFHTAAEAERAGYRPCLKCRPELAPGKSLLEAGSNLAREAAMEIEKTCGSDESLAELAARLGCTDRHLRRAFEEEYHVTPLQYRQTCRLLLAKKLLTDTDLSVLGVAMASGFGSLRRFNTVFESAYHMTPSALRKNRQKESSGDPARATGGSGISGSSGTFAVEVGYRPPYRWEELLAFLKMRAIPGVEEVTEDAYYRTVRIREMTGWIMVRNRPERNTLSVTVTESLTRALPQILARVRSLFDTDSDPMPIANALQSMGEIHPALPVEGLRVPGCFDPFETSVRAILGQQITVRAATTLAGRFASEFGSPIRTKREGLCVLFPEPGDLNVNTGGIGSIGNVEGRDAEKKMIPAAFDSENQSRNNEDENVKRHDKMDREDRTEQQDRMGRIGIIAARSRAIMTLAELIANKEPLTREKLLEIKGIGPWTADYISMRTRADTDVFLTTDYGVKKALAPRTPKEMEKLAEHWRPWRSYAVMNLWNLEA